VRRQTHVRCQYLYFCTSKASKLITRQRPLAAADTCPTTELLRCQFFFCTSKASKVRTCFWREVVLPHVLLQRCIRQHTSAYVSISHTSAHVKSCSSLFFWSAAARIASAYVSIRQHTLAHFLHTSACVTSHNAVYLKDHVSIRQHTSAYVSIRQHTSAYVSIRQHA
jgi:hypothetical protein